MESVLAAIEDEEHRRRVEDAFRVFQSACQWKENEEDENTCYDKIETPEDRQLRYARTLMLQPTFSYPILPGMQPLDIVLPSYSELVTYWMQELPKEVPFLHSLSIQSDQRWLRELTSIAMSLILLHSMSIIS